MRPDEPDPLDAALALLLGPDARDLLEAAVASAGGVLLTHRVTQVDHRPGDSTTVAFSVTVRWSDAVTTETLGASVGLEPVDEAAPGVVVLSDGATRVTVWRVPQDPGLPGFAVVADPATAGALVDSFGIDPTDLVIRQHAYRPRRRAVLELQSAGGQVFVKVVRPRRVSDLQARHRLLSDSDLPTPRSLGWTESGLVVLEALRGSPLRNSLFHDGEIPTGTAVLELLSRIPDAALDLPSRPSWTDNAQTYAAAVARAVPAEATRVGDLSGRVAEALAGLEPDAPVHGDLYDAQILTEGSRVTGLLDVDAAGPGRRADDLACLIAHAVVLGDMGLVAPATVDRALSGWLPAFDEAVDPVELRHRVAGVLISLATGPHRVQEEGWRAATSRRVDLVQRWVEAADRGTVPA